MDKKYNDITTGTQKLEGLKYNPENNNPEFLATQEYIKSLQDNDIYKGVDFSNARTQSIKETPYERYVGTEDLGESTYDEGIISEGQLYDLDNTRAELQPWQDKIAAGIGKGAVLAATTFVNGTIGLVYGLGALATGGEDGAYALSDFWDNKLTETLSNINQQSEAWMPNYYTNEELKNQQNGEWYKNIFTANFLGDGVIKNIGFVVGAAYSGKLFTSLAANLAQVGKVRNFLTGAADVTNTEAQAVFNGVKSLSQAEVLENGARIGKEIATKNIGLATVGSVTGALGEASIEAYGAADEFRKGEYANIEANRPVFMRQALEELYAYNPELVGTAQGEQILNSLLKEKEDNAKAKVEELAAHVGNVTFGTNVPLLTMSNMIQFGKFYSGGYKTGVKATNNAIKGATKEVLNEAGQVVGYEVAKRTPWKVTQALLKNATTEANEEMSQAAISRGAKIYGGNHLNDYMHSKVDPLASEESQNVVSSLFEGFNQAVADPNTYQEGFIGGLFGLLGLPSFSKVDGKLKVTMNGGAVEALKEQKETYAQAKKAVDYANQFISNDKMGTMFDSFVQHSYREEQKQDAIDNKDPFEFKNAEHKQLIEAIINFNKMGRLDVLENMATAYSNARSPEDVEAIRKEATKANEKSIFDGKSDEQVLEFVHKQAKDYLDTIEQYKNISEDLTMQIGDKFQGEDLEQMVWMFSNIDNLEKRFTEGWQKISQDNSFRNAIKNFKYKEADGTIKSLEDVFDTSPIEAIRILSSSKQNIFVGGATAEASLPFITKQMEAYQQQIKEKEEGESKRGINSMKKKLNRLQDELQTFTDLGTKYNDYLQNISDFEKIATKRVEFINKYNQYLYNPDSLKKENEDIIKTADTEKNQFDTVTTVETLKKAQTFDEFRTNFNGIKNPEVKKQVSDKLKEEDNALYNQLTNLENTRNRIERYVDSNTKSDFTIQDKEIAKQLLEQVYNRSTTEDELLDEYQYALETVYDQNNNDIPTDNAKRLISDVLKAISEKKKQAEQARTKATGQGTNQPTVPKEILPTGIISSGDNTDDSTPNPVITTKTETVLKNTGEGPVKQYLRSAIPAVDEQGRNNGKIVKFVDSNPEYQVLYDYLESKGAFQYIQDGKLSPGDKLHFFIDPTLSAKVKADLEAKGKGDLYTEPILMMHGNQVVGLLDSTIAKTQYNGLPELRLRIVSAFNEWEASNKPGDVFTYTQETIPVAHIFPGIVEYTDTENNLSQLFLQNDDKGKPAVSEDMILGVMGDKGIEVPNKSLDGQIINPVDASNKKGRVYLLTKGADGKWYPSLVKVTPIASLSTDSKRYQAIQQIVNDIAKVTEKDTLNRLVGLLGKQIFIGNINISLHTGDKGPFLFINKKVPQGTKENLTSAQIESRKVYLSDSLDFNAALNGGEVTMGDSTEVANTIMQKLIALDPYIQIEKNNLNNKGYSLQLLQDNILTINITSPKMEGGWFITDTIDPKTKKIVKAIKPEKVQTPVVNATTITGTTDTIMVKVNHNGREFSVDLSNNKVTQKVIVNGNEVIKQVTGLASLIIIDLAIIKNKRGSTKDSKKLYDDHHYYKDNNTGVEYFRVPGTDKIIEVANKKTVYTGLSQVGNNLSKTQVNDILDKKVTIGTSVTNIQDQIIELEIQRDKELEQTFPNMNLSPDNIEIIAARSDKNAIKFMEKYDAIMQKYQDKIDTIQGKSTAPKPKGTKETPLSPTTSISPIFNITTEIDSKAIDISKGTKDQSQDVNSIPEKDSPKVAYVTLRRGEDTTLVKVNVGILGEVNGKTFYYMRTPQKAGTTIEDTIKVVHPDNGVTNKSNAGVIVDNDIEAAKAKLLALLQKKPDAVTEIANTESLIPVASVPSSTTTTESVPQVDSTVKGAMAKFNKRFAPKPRLVTKKETSKQKLEKELNWLKRVLPRLNQNQVVKIHQGLIKINGKQAWGIYQKGVITLSDIAAEGTLYHEAFHLILDTLTTPEEKAQLFAEARQKWGNKSDNDLEELLAEEFRMYVAIREDNKSLGQRILNFFKSLLGMMDSNIHTHSNMYKFFEMVNKGKLSNRQLNKSTSKTMLRETTKPGVSELFESNPELANSIYETLGFKIKSTPQEFAAHYGGEEKSLYDVMQFYDSSIVDKEETSKFDQFTILISDFLRNYVTQNTDIKIRFLNFDNEKDRASFFKDSLAYYDSKKNTIIVDSNSGHINREAINIINHEIIHSITYYSYYNNIDFKEKLDALYEYSIKQKDKIRKDYYGFSNSIEFIAEAVSNPNFAVILDSIKSNNKNNSTKSLLDEIVDVIKQALSIFQTRYTNSERSVLNDVFELLNKYHLDTNDNQVLFQQKQQAQQLYSQYLDQIFPNSKVKDIVYHGSESQLSKLRKLKKSERNFRGEFQIEDGIFFSRVKEGEPFSADEYGPVHTLALLNVLHPELGTYYNTKIGRRVKQSDAILGSHIGLKESDTIEDSLKDLNKEYNTVNFDEWSNIIAVFNPEQIHILGSKDDIKGFKNFISQISNNIKPGVSDLFKVTPELSSIGTQEQYSQYLDTIFPDSKVKDIVYHGSNKKFDKFDYNYLPKADAGFYFTKDKNYAKNFGSPLSVLLNVTNPNYTNLPLNIEVVEKLFTTEYKEGTDSLIGKDAVLDLPKSDADVIVTMRNNQIHILGSKKDINGFKEFTKLGNINTKNLVDSEKSVIFAELDNEIRGYLELKGFTDTSWEQLTSSEKENEIKCVIG